MNKKIIKRLELFILNFLLGHLCWASEAPPNQQVKIKTSTAEADKLNTAKKESAISYEKEREMGAKFPASRIKRYEIIDTQITKAPADRTRLLKFNLKVSGFGMPDCSGVDIQRIKNVQGERQKPLRFEDCPKEISPISETQKGWTEKVVFEIPDGLNELLFLVEDSYFFYAPKSSLFGSKTLISVAIKEDRTKLAAYAISFRDEHENCPDAGKYIGEIGNGIKINFTGSKSSPNQQFGPFYYGNKPKKSPSDLWLEVTTKEDNFVAKEMRGTPGKGNQTGEFFGECFNGGIVQGLFSKPDGNRILPFEIMPEALYRSFHEPNGVSKTKDCLSKDLQFEVNGAVGLSGGAMMSWLRFKNTSSHNCRLKKVEKAKLRSEKGKIAEVGVTSSEDYLVRPGMTNAVELTWNIHCDEDVTKMRLQSTTPRVILTFAKDHEQLELDFKDFPKDRGPCTLKGDTGG